MKKINCQINVQVPDGPKLSESPSIEVEAYDCVNVTVPTTANQSVKVETGTGEGDVAFLLLKAERYEGLTYGLMLTRRSVLTVQSSSSEEAQSRT